MTDSAAGGPADTGAFRPAPVRATAGTGSGRGDGARRGGRLVAGRHPDEHPTRQDVWQRFRRDSRRGRRQPDPAADAMAVPAPIAPHDPTMVRGRITMGQPVGSSAKFLLGTDPLGRDLLSRIIYGARSARDGVLANGFALVLAWSSARRRLPGRGSYPPDACHRRDDGVPIYLRHRPGERAQTQHLILILVIACLLTPMTRVSTARSSRP